MHVKRKPVDKGKSRDQFVHRASRTARVNMLQPRRGGIRL